MRPSRSHVGRSHVGRLQAVWPQPARRSQALRTQAAHLAEASPMGRLLEAWRKRPHGRTRRVGPACAASPGGVVGQLMASTWRAPHDNGLTSVILGSLVVKESVPEIWAG